MMCPYEEGMSCPYLDTSGMHKTKECNECAYYKLFKLREKTLKYVK